MFIYVYLSILLTPVWTRIYIKNCTNAEMKSVQLYWIPGLDIRQVLYIQLSTKYRDTPGYGIRDTGYNCTGIQVVQSCTVHYIVQVSHTTPVWL